MKNFTIILLAVGLLLLSDIAAIAQTPVPVSPQDLTQHPRVNTHRKSFWSEINFQGALSKDKRWQYQFDLQYRRMSDARYVVGGAHGNIFKNPYQQVYRPWIHYWIVPGQVRLSLSPIGFWETYTAPTDASVYSTPETQVAGKNTNTGATVQPEFRICPQITFNNNYGRFQVVNRIRFEYRIQGNRHPASQNYFDDVTEGYSFYPNPQGQGYGSTHAGRLRWQSRVQIALNKKKVEPGAIYINAWDEVFISVGRYVNFNKMLNQNRLVAMVGFYLPTKYPIKIETGITYQTNLLYNIGTVPTQPDVTYSKQNVEQNLAYTTYVIFDNFHSFLRKKKVEAPAEK